MIDKKFMLRAIELAKKGIGKTNPNPLVGAVIVKDGKIISEGFHEAYGKPHAERAALSALEKTKGSAEDCNMYVTLEPCCHYGKQPPCTDAIIESGIRHVIIGSADPNPLVAGKGISILRNHGIEVTENFMRKECDDINPVFFHYIKTGTPFVVMKYAMTTDGKIASFSGASKWITGEAARRRVHEDRNRYSGIMVGIGTILKDDPLLTCRLPDGHSPVRIICDSKLITPIGSQIVKTACEIETIIATCCSDEDKYPPYLKAGCRIVRTQSDEGCVDLNYLMAVLGKEKIDSILLEGGSTLNWSALKCGIVNKVQTYIAPKILGGKTAPSPVGGQGAMTPDSAFMLSKPHISVIGNDLLLESEVLKCSRE